MANVDRELWSELYRRMVRIRTFETEAEKAGLRGEIPGALHTAAGQEGEIVGACMALRSDDYMVGNHRSHGHPIGKGAALRPLMAELFGKRTGVCHGKGGSMHLADFSIGSLGETSIVGSGLPVAVGAALGSAMQKNDRVTLCFFGDGASNEGTFHESLNLAAIWRLPVIFLCENNGYGATTPAASVMAVKDVAERAKAYAIPGSIVDGQDVLGVYHHVREFVERARRGDGPALIEAKTYRYADHAVNMGVAFGTDRGEELERWKRRDPIALFRARLIEAGIAEESVRAIEEEVRISVEDALLFARASEYPAYEETFDDVFAARLPVS
ncbi:MAG TPA: thiamine pyrophosphate-dependent dehydrogenase E1 component subunit alpha [Steroidobacteraceae bacterium]|nr:thiamine pyrophosphate-dependent dehydrogenase E1 component subunit alpha [Steroidobacteraceae bacterium]